MSGLSASMRYLTLEESVEVPSVAELFLSEPLAAIPVEEEPSATTTSSAAAIRRARDFISHVLPKCQSMVHVSVVETRKKRDRQSEEPSVCASEYLEVLPDKPPTKRLRRGICVSTASFGNFECDQDIKVAAEIEDQVVVATKFDGHLPGCDLSGTLYILPQPDDLKFFLQVGHGRAIPTAFYEYNASEYTKIDRECLVDKL